MQTLTDTPLGRTIAETPTDIWNDSCNVDELAYAVDFGAVGATANPTIVVDNWQKDPDQWAGRVRELAVEQPTLSERELAMADRGRDERPRGAAAAARLRGLRWTRRAPLDPDRSDPLPDDRAMVEQALRLRPAWRRTSSSSFRRRAAGIAGHGGGDRTAGSASTPRSRSASRRRVAAAEAVERGIARREADGHDTSSDGPGDHDHDGTARGLAARGRRS